jgi:hypothetical protein
MSQGLPPVFPRPNNFPYQEVFYSDGDVAMMRGRYKEAPHESLGMRWTQAESDLGYPNIHGHGMWMVVPDTMAVYILEGIVKNIEKEKDSILSIKELIDTLILIRARLP